MRPALGLRLGLASLIAALELATLLPVAQAQTAAPTVIRDYPVPGGWFYSQENRLPIDSPPFRGYTVVDDQDASFWTEFRRYGGVDVLGYPVTRRYRYPDTTGYLYQAFQRGILQWRPEFGRADLANIFEQFTDQGLDDKLEVIGIPRPAQVDPLPFAEDTERRMGWLSEPRFLARYLFDPVAQQPFDFQEQAWAFFGLPQGVPERPVYLREKDNGKYGAPLYLNYVAQRFQKAGLEMFLADTPLDPTIVPGDGKAGCISLTAVGRIARRIGAGKIFPNGATQPEPLENPPKSRVIFYIPQSSGVPGAPVDIEVVGTGFQPGEPVTLRFTPEPSNGQPSPYPTVVSRVDAVDADGSFDQMVSLRVATYDIFVLGEWSHLTLDPSVDHTINTGAPTVDTSANTRTTYC